MKVYLAIRRTIFVHHIESSLVLGVFSSALEAEGVCETDTRRPITWNHNSDEYGIFATGKTDDPAHYYDIDERNLNEAL